MFSLKKKMRGLPYGLTLAALSTFTVSSARATSIYVANPNSAQLQVVNTAANGVSTLSADPNSPRGLVFTDTSNIVYTTLVAGRLDDYNLATHSNTVLDSFAVNQSGSYVALDPGGASVIFSVGGAGIDRYNLTTHAVTNVSSYFDPRGLTYDAEGNLFAVLGSSELAQIDPLTGAVIKSVTLPSSGSAGANGLAFDTKTGELFVTDDINDLTKRGLYEISTSLTGETLVNQNVAGNGLAADGKGNLWIANLDTLDNYNTGTHVLTAGPLDPGGFGVALAPAASVASGTPEPASLLLIGVGLAALGAVRRRIRG